MAKLLFYDLETSGLSSYKHGIIELGYRYEVNGILEAEDVIKMNPRSANIECDSKTLEFLGYTIEDLDNLDHYHIGYERFEGFLNNVVDRFDSSDKIVLVGYNNRKFDDNFLRSFFYKNNNKFFGSYFYSASIDVISMAAEACVNLDKFPPSFKLSEVAKFFDIPVKEESLHEAGYDIELTVALYNKFTNRNLDVLIEQVEQEDLDKDELNSDNLPW